MASENIQKSIELIEKSDHIAILFNPEESLDVLASAEVFAKSLIKKGKEVGFFQKPAPDKVNEPLLFKIIPSAPSLLREFIISVDAGRSPISQLRYEKEGENLNIILSPKSSTLSKEAVNFREGEVLCECAIALGIPDIERLNGKHTPPDFLSRVPIINIDISEDNSCYGEVNLVRPDKSSLAEVSYELITALGGEILEKESATLLLVGLMEKTSVFQDGADADTHLAVSELIRLGADQKEASRLVKKSRPIELLQLFGRASVRSKLEKERGALWSFLTAEDFEKTGRGPQDIFSVINHLHVFFPPHALQILLWQDSRERTIRATFSGKRPLLEKLHTLADSSFRSPQLELTNGFNSFREAEEYISSLLKEVL